MSKSHPPQWAIRFLRWYCKEEYLDEIEGDLFELYFHRVDISVKKADLFFIWNVFRSFRWVNLKTTQNNNWTMNLLKNYTKIYFRRFRKETVHYLVNILGLGLGFSILFFILMFVNDEQNIDTFHSKKDRIYRVVEKSQEQDGLHEYISTPGPLADALKQDFAGIEETAHISYTGSQVIAKGENRITDRDWAFVTKSIFDILDIEIIKGDPKKDFQGEAGLILTEDAALRLFGKTDIVGEVVDESRFGSIEVLAIMDEMPRNSTYQYQELYVVNYDQWSEGWQQFLSGWNYRFTSTWVLLEENVSPEDIYAGKEAFLEKYYDEESRVNHDFYFQPITEIHLGSSGIERGGMSPREVIPSSTNEFVTVILLLGFLVLFIASLNYINLSSVQALKRTLEASMRKINGATNKQLVGQLFFEAFLTVTIAYLLSLVFVVLFFSYFLEISNKDFSLSMLFSADFILYHVTSTLLIWVVSAMLPAIYYSKLKRSLLILKNAFSGRGDFLRKGLVGVQYALAIFLIIGSIVIYRQLDFVQSKDLGFDNNNLIVLDINSGKARANFKNIIQGIKTNANVINASTSSRVPGEWKNIPTANLSKTQTDEALEASHYAIDQFWLNTYGIELVEGNSFSGVDNVDSLHILINKQAAEMLDLEEPIGSKLWVLSSQDSVRMTIIGVTEDFHFESLYVPIGPIVFTSWNNHVRSIDYFTVRYSQNPRETVSHIEQVNATFDPDTPPEINFLDQQWNRFYQEEESRATITLIASIVSIVISAFGLFGLINFTVERKTKEIGIRKVMGASLHNITGLILKDYFVLLLISLLVATPISWWLFSDWLQSFAYRIDLSIDLYVIAFLIVMIISFSTVLARIFRIAKANPVNSIRYE